MASTQFSLSNLPAGWSAGLVGDRQVFRTPEGKQISAQEATSFFDTDRFTGFGSSDSIVSDPIVSDTGPPPKTTETLESSLSVDRPVYIPGLDFDDTDAIAGDLSLMNGGNMGAGIQKPVTVDPLGGATGKGSPSLVGFGPEDGVGGGSEDIGGLGGLGGETDQSELTPRAPVFNDDFSLINPDANIEERDLNAIKQIAADQGLTADEAYQLWSGPQGPGPDATDGREDNRVGRDGLTFGDGSVDQRSKDRVKEYQGSLAQLGEGDIDSVLADYKKRIKDGNINPGGIGSSGRPPQPEARILGVGLVQVSWGQDENGNTGWGYIGEDDFGGAFIITAETSFAGEEYNRDNAQIDQMEDFIERMAAAQSDDARTLIIQQQMALLNEEIADDARIENQRNAESNIDQQGDIQKDLQEVGQDFASDQADIDREIAKLEAETGRTFRTEEREAIQSYQDSVRATQREEEVADRISDEEFATGAAELGREFTTEERLAIQTFQTSRDVLERSQSVKDREDVQAQQTSERVAGEETAAGVARLAENLAVKDREDRQQQETDERVQGEQFTRVRDQLNFDRESRLESVRLGIADATSESGIQRAVELADEARGLERAQTMLNVVEQIASSGLGRQLADSGILEQLAAEFGVDLSFLMRGGLGGGVGSGGNAPVRVTA